MNSSPNRARSVVSGCICCSLREVVQFEDERVKHKARLAKFKTGVERSKSKPKGQHAYRKGAVIL